MISLKYYISFIVTVLAFQGFSQLIQPFNARYSTSQKGGIRILSNVSVSCNSGTSCTSATSEIPPSGTNSNGGFTMNYVDLDGLSSTFMSSSDSLNLLNCSEILWAGLYWSGRATSSVTNWNLRNQVKIRVGNGAYQNLSADELVNAQSLGSHPSYHCFKNITSIVQSAGIKARFTVANVVTQTGGSNYWGGWSIIVVYKNVFQSMRNLTVFDGFGNISAGSSLDIPISGFATPPSGPVGFELGVIAFEGDRGSTGDQLQFNGAGTFVNVSDAMHNTTDFFNSTISYGAVLTPFRIPSLNNSLGYDASIFLPNNSSFNFIGNNATSATIRVTTSSENILARAFTSAIDIYEPDLRADVRINDLNGGLVAPGDILEYTLVGKNIGSDLSLNTFMVDTLDPRTVYIPNSISYTFGSNNGVKTDLTGDDQAEYNAVNKTLKFRIGTGANNVAGGQVTASSTGADSTVVKFRVQVINDCLMFQCDSTLSHVAYIYGTGNISGNSYNNGGASDTYDANGCPSEASNVLLIDVSGCPPPTIGFNPPVCVGESLVLTASFSAAANYAWTGPLLFSTNGNTQTITNSQVANSGQYNVHITFPGLNCSLDTSLAVVIHPNPILNLDSLKHVTCFNAANGKIYVSASSGTPVYQYQWTPGNLAGPSITNLAPGNYTVIVSDANTCTSTATYTITQPTALSALASITSNYNGRNISCFGASDGSASVSYSGGTAPYLINWSPGGATTPSVSNLGSGTYTATITDANGCIKTSSVTLTQPTVLTSSHTQVNVSCFGGSDGSINLSNGG
ncbi:MAG: SprB repeat-containing protein, partial [Crocinitomicaceae bacterium]|nr:SprB repeat-containing protein [Crocinitomicaceae bacterium]